jgi:ADP-ribose pyrophosphatase YjhB (NUDIX family)
VSDRRYPSRALVAVSAVIVGADDRVLLARRARPPSADLFTCPGGAVEPGETLAEAVRREVAEETGLDVRVLGLAGVRETIVRDAEGKVEHHWVILAHAVALEGGTLAANEELAELRWVTPADLDALPTTPALGEVLEAGIALVRAAR